MRTAVQPFAQGRGADGPIIPGLFVPEWGCAGFQNVVALAGLAQAREHLDGVTMRDFRCTGFFDFLPARKHGDSYGATREQSLWRVPASTRLPGVNGFFRRKLPGVGSLTLTSQRHAPPKYQVLSKGLTSGLPDRRSKDHTKIDRLRRPRYPFPP
jgi:hypothetical protein